MNFIDFETGNNDTNRRLDRVIRKFLPTMALTTIYKNIRTGFIRIEGKKVKQNYKIQEKDCINIAEILLSTIKKEKNARESISFTKKDFISLILFKNEHILILNKPYDMPVQKAKNTTIALDDIVKTYTENTDSLSFTPGPLHRLDRKTSGAIAFSQSIKGAHYFSEQMTEKNIKKEYIAVVIGSIKKECHWIDYISESNPSKENSFYTVNVYTDEAKGKIAITHVYPIDEGFFHKIPISLVRIVIETGRTHQIRAQCAFHGHSLLGDSAYKKEETHASFIHDFFLHAYSLSFPKENLLDIPEKIIAPLRDDFLNFTKTHFPNCSFRFIV